MADLERVAAELRGPTTADLIGGTGAGRAQRTHGMGAASVIVDEGRRVLLVRHSYGRRNWEIPGGISEAGESAETTARREAREELGVEIEIDRLSGVYWEPGWQGIGGHHFVFRARLADAAVPRAADADEILEFRWCSAETLPRPISNFTIRRVHDALADGPAPFAAIGPRVWTE